MIPADSPRGAAQHDRPLGHCAHHPGVPAVLVCTRCGDYVCRPCASSAFPPRPFCERCAGSDHESLRRELGPHERQVRALALLYWLSTLTFAAVAVVGVVSAADAPWVGLVGTPLAALFGVTAWQLQRFGDAARPLGTIASLLGLCGFPTGTLLSAFALWVLHSRRGKAAFTPRYRAAIAATPHLKYGISLVTKVLLGLLAAVLLAGALAATLGVRKTP